MGYKKLRSKMQKITFSSITFFNWSKHEIFLYQSIHHNDGIECMYIHNIRFWAHKNCIFIFWWFIFDKLREFWANWATRRRRWQKTTKIRSAVAAESPTAGRIKNQKSEAKRTKTEILKHKPYIKLYNFIHFFKI